MVVFTFAIYFCCFTSFSKIKVIPVENLFKTYNAAGFLISRYYGNMSHYSYGNNEQDMQQIGFKNSLPLSYFEVLTVVNYNSCRSNMDKLWFVASKNTKI